MAVIGWLQVINAALALAAKPNSKVAQDNMDLFKEQWEKQVRVLTDAVDDITSIDDFLSVSGKFLFTSYIRPKSVYRTLLESLLLYKEPFCAVLYGWQSCFRMESVVSALSGGRYSYSPWLGKVSNFQEHFVRYAEVMLTWTKVCKWFLR